GKKRKKSAGGGGKDLISKLPDEILHSIIRRIASSKEAEKTIVLSNRWRNLWRSYPVVQLNPKTSHRFYSIGSEGFMKFHDATMKRFNQDKLLRMEALKLSIRIKKDDLNSPNEDNFRSSAVEQLLELASERKAEYVDIEICFKSCSSLCLPFRLLSNSSTKTLKLEKIRFASDNNDYFVVLNSLRSLHLDNVEFDDKRLFTNLIASSPLLETLKLESVTGMKKPWVSDVAKLKTLRFLHLNDVELDEQLLADLIASSPLLETLKLVFIFEMRKLVVCNAAANLKKLEIYDCYRLKEIQIAASGLRDLHIEESGPVLSIGLIAPQLNVLNLHCHSQLSLSEISLDDLNHLRFLCLDNLTIDDEQVFLNWIAGRPLLETLEIRNIKNLKKLKLSNLPNLKTLVVTDCIDLKEIGLIAPQLNVLHISCCYNSSFCVMSCGDLNHLRSLDLGYLRFDDEQVFLNLIAGNPLLETLQLTSIKHLKKLQLSNVPNLKTLGITDCINLKEIEISAHKLHSLHLEKDFKRNKSKRMLRKIELIAPQLNDLKITNYDLRMVELKAIVCNLQYLKSLDLFGIAGIGLRNYWMLEFSKMLQFAGRKLEEFILWVSRELKEMEVDADAGPSVVKFLLYYDEFFDNNTIHPKLSRHLKRTMNHG
ncbi:F-box/LRR-repeat protein 13, partial [Linum perenne]